MDSLSIFVIGGLFCVILAEFIFLIYVVDIMQKEKARLLDELAKANTAIVAKDANQYAMMRAMDTVPTVPKEVAPEGVDASELTDDEYDKMLKEQLKGGR